MELKVGDKVRVNTPEANGRMNAINGTIFYIDENIPEYKYFVEVEANKTFHYSANELDFLERPSDKLKLSIDDFEIGTLNSAFGCVLSEMLILYQKKNHDYGDSFSTLFKEFGLIYSVPRIYEKATRLKTLLNAKNEVSESVRDTLIDLASYCVMTIVELDKERSKL